jgi:hypothetical protein
MGFRERGDSNLQTYSASRAPAPHLAALPLLKTGLPGPVLCGQNPLAHATQRAVPCGNGEHPRGQPGQRATPLPKREPASQLHHLRRQMGNRSLRWQPAQIFIQQEVVDACLILGRTESEADLANAYGVGPLPPAFGLPGGRMSLVQALFQGLQPRGLPAGPEHSRCGRSPPPAHGACPGRLDQHSSPAIR